MGRLSRLLAFLRRRDGDVRTSEAQIDPGGGANVTALHVSAPGDDACPLPGDTVVTVPCSGRGREVVVGYIDTANTPSMEAGGRRIYARRDDGTLACSIRLLPSGEVFIDDGADGNTIVRIDQDGIVHLGAAAGAAFLARADRVEAELLKIKNAINAAGVSAGDGGASFKANIIAALNGSSMGAAGSTAATKVKGT